MYQNKFVAAIRANGKILREFTDTVYIPFSTEYEICLKNLNSVRAIVNIFIDGDNVIPGGLVLQDGQEINLERFVKNGNLNEGNRFKFVERTGAIESHRGIKLEDGIIRIEFQFEKEPPYTKYKEYARYNKSTSKTTDVLWGDPNWGTLSKSTILRSLSGSTMTACDNVEVKCCNSTVSLYNDAGITVPGSKSEQKFSTASWFPTEAERHTIVLKLVGETPNNKPIDAPITVKYKQECTFCGKLNKATNKFCSDCGAALTIY